MASPRPPSLAQAPHYRVPELLHDIRLLDLLELCGTTVQTSRLLQLSQPAGWPTPRGQPPLPDPLGGLWPGARSSPALGPLGVLPLALGFCPEAPVLVGAVPEVLVPDRGVPPGLRRLLRELGLTLRSGGNSLQTPDDWIRRIHGSSLALVVADREADTWASLPRGPLASRPQSPVWLALPADWQEHPVLRHTAQELGRMGGPLLQQRRFSEARPLLETLLQLEPEHPEALYNLGVLASEEGKLEEARRMQRFGSAGRGREKPGCAWSALAADWDDHPLPQMPDQPRQALPQ
jgi:hypothetical protein